MSLGIGICKSRVNRISIVGIASHRIFTHVLDWHAFRTEIIRGMGLIPLD